eukprot:1406987-Ditylum_brightwellii.AAC.1
MIVLLNISTGVHQKIAIGLFHISGNSTRSPQRKKVDCNAEVNCPNIVLLDRRNQSALIIEVSCPADADVILMHKWCHQESA